jgi:phosphoserine phosphatase
VNVATRTNLLVVDVCGTLVRDDTTMGLVAHHLSVTPTKSIHRLIFALITARFSPLRMGFVLLERITQKHLLKHIVMRLLAGDSEDSLKLSAMSYANYLLANRKVLPVWDILNAHMNSNGRVILASASLEPIVECLANSIGADFVASKLEADNGILTGRYIIDLTGRKEAEIEDKYSGSLVDGKFRMISDNITDKCLMERAAESFVVLHKESHRARWNGLNAEILDLN